MTVTYCYMEGENYKLLKFCLSNFSYFEISISLFKVPPSNKGCTSSLQNSINAVDTY